MSKERQEEQTARIIWHGSLQQSALPFKWGLDFGSIKASKSGTRFSVSNPAAKVFISSKGQNFKITVVRTRQKGCACSYENVNLSDIVSTIDHILTELRNPEDMTSTIIYEPEEYHKTPTMTGRAVI
jgi:carbohydrate-binding DOMON domain-containing protein